MKQKDKVLFTLRKKKDGTTVHDFPTGFRLSAYILYLRDAGFRIETIMEYFPNRRQRARYVLISEPR